MGSWDGTIHWHDDYGASHLDLIVSQLTFLICFFILYFFSLLFVIFFQFVSYCNQFLVSCLFILKQISKYFLFKYFYRLVIDDIVILWILRPHFLLSSLCFEWWHSVVWSFMNKDSLACESDFWRHLLEEVHRHSNNFCFLLQKMISKRYSFLSQTSLLCNLKNIGYTLPFRANICTS